MTLPPWQGFYSLSLFSFTWALDSAALLSNLPGASSDLTGASCVGTCSTSGAEVSLSGDIGHYSVGRLWNSLNEHSKNVLEVAANSILAPGVSVTLPRFTPLEDALGLSHIAMVEKGISNVVPLICSTAAFQTSTSLLPLSCTTSESIPGSLQSLFVLWNVSSSSGTEAFSASFSAASSSTPPVVKYYSPPLREVPQPWMLLSSSASKDAEISIAQPRVSSIVPAPRNLSTDGGYTVTLRGSNFGRVINMTSAQAIFSSLNITFYALRVPGMDTAVNTVQKPGALLLVAEPDAGAVVTAVGPSAQLGLAVSSSLGVAASAASASAAASARVAAAMATISNSGTLQASGAAGETNNFIVSWNHTTIIF
jgi:hypothetical protein